MQYTNHLASETSPYLLQHAHNPVNWYPWGAEALSKARAEDKPILVSIGYSSCHWCHVMERESFEDLSTAELMNQKFINIKIDREERPDLDHIYMDALQAMTGSGGWPLNVFLTPDLKPFYGGTYFPPVKMHNRASWKEVLTAIANTFSQKRSEIENQADQLLIHLKEANSFGISKKNAIEIPAEELFVKRQADIMYANIMQTADTEWGGFGKAPKFPQTFTIGYLLRYYYFTHNEAALNQACLSLDKIIQGGICDQLGGGFARYSTDVEWLAPHFEKMLYDNALLVIALSDAYKITKQQRYKTAITETLSFIEREMTSPENGFYSALDADSEGVEGKYYTWSKKEVQELLKDDAELFCDFYDISEKGNWEAANILRMKQRMDIFCATHQLDATAFDLRMKNCRQILLAARSKRIRPLLDDKIILGWNALMNSAYSKAFAALGNNHYKLKAISNMQFLLKAFKTDGAGLHHVYKNGKARNPAFLDDYAFLIQSLIHLQEITSDVTYLEKAKQLTDFVKEHFSDTENGYFWFTPQNQDDIIVRKKEIYDGATPSGNAVMACNLVYLGIVFDKADWKNQAVKMLDGLQEAVIKYPGSFGVWAGLYLNMIDGYNEIAVVGSDFNNKRNELLLSFLPDVVIQAAEKEDSKYPILAGKTTPFGETLIYLCKNYACHLPAPDALKIKEVLSFKGN
ncbi:MAG: thioredoxin domain-containing protein [Lacibacter sp.]